MLELTAISPKPSLVTATLVNKSGTDVPAANMVKPITMSGIPNAAPAEEDHQTMKYEYTPIHNIENTKLISQYFLYSSFRVSGMV